MMAPMPSATRLAALNVRFNPCLSSSDSTRRKSRDFLMNKLPFAIGMIRFIVYKFIVGAR
jgi:hypothetical protein